MPPLQTELLNPLAAMLASELAARHPEWLERASSERNGDLLVELAAPSESDLSAGLWLATECGEVNVGFDDYHRHFGDLAAPDQGASQSLRFVNDAVDLAENILLDRIASISWFDSDRIRASGHIETDRPFRVESAGLRTRIRSWSGRFNRDIPQPFAYRIGLRKVRVSKIRVVSETSA